MPKADYLFVIGAVAIVAGADRLIPYYQALSSGLPFAYDVHYVGDFLIGCGIVLILVGVISRPSRKWDRFLKLRTGLLILALALFSLGAIDVLAAWTVGMGENQGVVGSNFMIIEGVDFRLLVTEITLAALLTVLSLLIDVYESSLSLGP